MGYIRESAPMAREFYPEHTARLPIPDNEKAEGEGVMNIFRRGCFYNVYGNDALLLNKHFGYNITLNVTDVECTGFNLKCRDAVFKRLVDLRINYDVYDQSGRIVALQKATDILLKNFYPATSDSKYYQYFDNYFVKTASLEDVQEIVGKDQDVAAIMESACKELGVEKSKMYLPTLSEKNTNVDKSDVIKDKDALTTNKELNI